MGQTVVATPTSRLRFGHARVDVTPPVGIYNRMWGAARHDRATGVHRPLHANVMVLESPDRAQRLVRAELDLCGLAHSVYERLAAGLAEAAGVAREQVSIGFSHTHSAGWLWPPERFIVPGGELVGPYLELLAQQLSALGAAAATTATHATITYGVGRCDMAANRDYWDDARGLYATGFNPDGPAEDRVVVGRVTAIDGRRLATLVHYACHPTTLAWQNDMISPDYVGAMRETVEAATGAPCLFMLGACGELGPRRGFVGDTAVADANGRQLGHAALSALAALPAPLTDFAYDGPVLSGATLGAWSEQPQITSRSAMTERFSGGRFAVELRVKERPTRQQLEAEIAERERAQRAADVVGDAAAVRDHGAMIERARRWLGRLDDLPTGATVQLPFTIWRLGDALWISCAGEPYSWLAAELRRRFPDDLVLVSPLAGMLHIAYLLPRDRYGRGLYQEEPSILAPGCLEALADAIASQVRS